MDASLHLIAFSMTNRDVMLGNGQGSGYFRLMERMDPHIRQVRHVRMLPEYKENQANVVQAERALFQGRDCLFMIFQFMFLILSTVLVYFRPFVMKSVMTVNFNYLS